MARIALTRNDETPFTPEDYAALPEEERPVFRIVPLTGAQRHEVNVLRASGFVGEIDDQKARFDMAPYLRAMLLAASHGLRGWSHVEDERGDPVVWPGSGAEAVRLLPTSIAQEIGKAIVARSNLTAEQQGN